MKNQKTLGNKGFSLVELIVVIAIMAVLMGVLAPTLIGNIEKSRESKDLTNLDTIYNAVNVAVSTESGAAAVKTTYAGKTTALKTILGADDKFATSMKETLGSTVDNPACASADSSDYYVYITTDYKAVVFCKPATANDNSEFNANFAQAEKNDKPMYVGNSEIAKNLTASDATPAGGKDEGGKDEGGNENQG